jgi:hypothetical protein
MDYEKIKKFAKEKKCSVLDCIALSAQNDPFYVGMKSQIRMAEWFERLWHDFGYAGGNGIHVRRIHYKAVSKDVVKPNGLLYKNTEPDWGFLDNASKYARYLQLVPAASFDDRKNAAPQINSKLYVSQPWLEVEEESLFNSFSLPDFPRPPNYKIINFDWTQRYHLELWAEKSTMNDILEPLCKRYGVNFIYGTGELSLTHALGLVNRLERRYNRPCRIFYVSDFDPAGMSMPVAVARKIEKFLYDLDDTFDVRLEPVVLTPEQCQKYSLPRTPLKPTEKRAGQFEDRFGAGATELDALEALHPGELKKILEKKILQYYDRTLPRRTNEKCDELIKDLGEVRKEVLETDDRILELEDLERQYENLREHFHEELSDISRSLENLYQVIGSDLEQKMPDIEKYPVPAGKDAEEPEDVLFNSKRDYFSQLAAYKAFQGKRTDSQD